MRISSSFIAAIVASICSLSLSALFILDYYLPLSVGMAGLYGTTLWVFLKVRSSTLGLLPKLYTLLLSMPFWTIGGYLLWGDFDWWPTPQIQAASDETNLQIMVHIGLVGILSFGAGAFWVSPPIRVNQPLAITPKILNLPGFFLAATLCTIAAKLSAPEGTILSEAYGSLTESAADSINFVSLSLIAQSAILLLGLDYFYELNSVRKLMKKYIVWGLLFITVIFFGALRGDRDSLGLVCALLFAYITRLNTSSFGILTLIRRYAGVTLLLVSLLGLFIIIQSVRIKIADQTVSSFSEEFTDSLKYNTWTAVLLNNLGSAREFTTSDFNYLWGKTYYEYLLSLPPGAIARFLGYERPLETISGPNWWFSGFSVGGMHPVIVPFHNFGILGVFFIVSLQGWLIAKVDSLERRGFSQDLWIGMFSVIAFRWFWYGDMNFVRGVMIGAILLIAYRLAAPFQVNNVPTPNARGNLPNYGRDYR